MKFYGLKNDIGGDTSAAHAVIHMIHTFRPIRDEYIGEEEEDYYARGQTREQEYKKRLAVQKLRDLFVKMDLPGKNGPTDTTELLRAVYFDKAIDTDPVKFFTELMQRLHEGQRGCGGFVGRMAYEPISMHMKLPVKDCENVYESLNEYLKTPV